MSCERFQNQIALYVAGDLDERDARRVEPHLEACPACRELAAGLEESRAALGDLREADVDPAVLGRIRRQVLEKVETRQPSLFHGWRWKHAFFLAAAVVILAVALAPRLRQSPSEPALAPPGPPAVVAAKPQPPAPIPHRRARARPAVMRPPEPAVVKARGSSEPLVVKMLTDDPDVVIIWLIDQNGDGA